MVELPRGTVTLVFTDIEGSTRLLASLGSRYEAVLVEHRKLLRHAFSSHGGVEVDTQGDAFFFAFSRATDAVGASVEAQRAVAEHSWPQGAELRVRMGIHTGEPVLSGEGYVGQDVHRAARICSAAHGGQVVISEASARLLGAGIQGVTLRDLGSHGLKDLKEPEHLYQLVIPGLREDFPALRSLDARPHNLPRQLTAVVGREEEIKKGCRLLLQDDTTLVSLTGPGGTGKTRLALALGQELLDSFGDGVFFVELAAITDPALVIPAVAQALSLKESGTKSITETLTEHLADKEMLLILDNFEQVIEAASEVSSLLTSAQGIKVLITTREPLRLRAERELEVPPLGLPPPEAEDLATLASSPAVALFTERAGAVKASFELSEDNAASVAEICHRLDGLPLALELAAARIRTMSPSSLLARLDRSLEVLSGGARDLADRQRTLRAAISWSYELLDEEERRLFGRLGVFAGGFTSDAAEAVCDRGDLSVPVWEGLSSLVDKSLVRLNDTDEERFSMLETIRSFALERLEEFDEPDIIRTSHAEFFRAVAEDAWRNLIGAEAEAWLRRLDTEIANLRSALSHGVIYVPETALATAGALWRFWWARGYLNEGRSFLEDALRSAKNSSTPLRARALRGLGVIAQGQGDNEAAATAASEALSLFEEIGDMGGQASSWETLAFVAQEDGDFSTARERFELVRRLCTEAGEEIGKSGAIGNLGNVALLTGEFDEAYRLAQESMSLDEKLGDTAGVAQSLINMGLARLGQESLDEALELLSQGLSLAQQVDYKELIAAALEGLAAAAAARRESSQAKSLLQEADHLRERSGHVRGLLERRIYDETLVRLQSLQEDAAGTPQ